MGILSAEFLLLVIMALLLFHAFRTAWWRKGVLACASLIFVCSYAGNGELNVWTIPGALSPLPMIVFALTGFAAIKVTGSVPSWLLTLALISVYGLVRYMPAWSGSADWVMTVGASYILFRILHLVFDKSQQTLGADPRLIDYFSYLFFFPTFLAGPVWRYEEYCASRNALAVHPDGETIYFMFSRIANGCMKILIMTWICGVFHGIFVDLSVFTAGDRPVSSLYFSLAALTYLLVFYYDFSGYMDIMIGVGGLFGLTVPENFNAPFQSADILDFWSRWHMTLSQWMQRYLFMPLVAWLSRRFLGRARIQVLGALGYFAVFLVVGIWHGISLRYVVFGCILGLAASTTKLWDSWLMKLVFRRKEGAVRKHIVYRKLMNALALFIVTSALVPLWITHDAMALVSPPFVLYVFILGTLGTAVLSFLDRFFREVLTMADRPGRLKTGKKWSQTIASLGSELWLATRCVAVFGILAVHNTDMPAFLYQGY